MLEISVESEPTTLPSLVVKVNNPNRRWNDGTNLPLHTPFCLGTQTTLLLGERLSHSRTLLLTLIAVVK